MAVEHSPAISVGVDLHRMNLELISTSAEAVEPETDGGLRMNESAFRALYEQTATPLLRYLIGITRTTDIAEDVLQETYCRFLTARLPEMDDRETRNYLFRIATNLIHDRWRRGNDEPLPADSAEIAAPTPPTTEGSTSGTPLTASNPASVNCFGSPTSKSRTIRKSPNTPGYNPEASAFCFFGRGASWPTSSERNRRHGRCQGEN